MIASDSRSRKMGMDFFFPFLFPNFGNVFFIPFPFPNFGDGFFHSFPDPELQDWNYPFPFPPSNSKKSFPLTPVGEEVLVLTLN